MPSHGSKPKKNQTNKEKIQGKKGKGTISSAFKIEKTLQSQKNKSELQEINTLPRKERSKRVREILKSRGK